jgi:hypothetical protein
MTLILRKIFGFLNSNKNNKEWAGLCLLISKELPHVQNDKTSIQVNMKGDYVSSSLYAGDKGYVLILCVVLFGIQNTCLARKNEVLFLCKQMVEFLRNSWVVWTWGYMRFVQKFRVYQTGASNSFLVLSLCIYISSLTFFFFFCCTGFWTQGLHLEPLYQSFFVNRFFSDRVSELFA